MSFVVLLLESLMGFVKQQKFKVKFYTKVQQYLVTSYCCVCREYVMAIIYSLRWYRIIAITSANIFWCDFSISSKWNWCRFIAALILPAIERQRFFWSSSLNPPCSSMLTYSMPRQNVPDLKIGQRKYCLQYSASSSSLSW